MTQFACTNCGRPYPEEGAPYKCPKCGGLFDVKGSLDFDPAQVDFSQPGIWRYRQSFGLPLSLPPVSLGEGSTPFVWAEVFGRQVAFKAEYLNPTGSFKDRGTTVITTFLKSRGITIALEDSSGNAGASFAAYAARAGLTAGIYAPAYASGPKLEQIKFYGAQLNLIPGTRADVTRAVERDVISPAPVMRDGISHYISPAGRDNIPAYASHAYLPFNVPGYATAAYEIYQQLGTAPGAVVCPVGQGGLFLGVQRGFEALKRCGAVQSIPKMVGVQARACSPLWILSTAGISALGFITEGANPGRGHQGQKPAARRGHAQVGGCAPGRICGR